MDSVRYLLGQKLSAKVARKLRCWAGQLDGGGMVTGQPLSVVKTVCGIPCKLEILRGREDIHPHDAGSFYGPAMVQAAKDELAHQLAKRAEGHVHFTTYETYDAFRIEAELFTYKPVQQ